MKTLGIVGGGVLGRACARGFMEMCEVKVFDVDKDRATHSLSEVAQCEIVMFCLPTPAKSNGECDTSFVEASLEMCDREGWWTKDSCYTLRSTIPVGFTLQEAKMREWRLPLLHSPEFLTARCAITDFQTPARNIIGEPGFKIAHCPECAKKNLPAKYCAHCGAALKFDATDIAKETARRQALLKLNALYSARFPGVECKIMRSDESELVKLASNAFFATKVTLFNVLYDLARAKHLDWEVVRGGILSDGRIAHAHTAVPGPVDSRAGFSGSCLPKDTADLFHCCQAAGVDAELLREVLARNERSRGDDLGLTRVKLPQ